MEKMMGPDYSLQRSVVIWSIASVVMLAAATFVLVRAWTNPHRVTPFPAHYPPGQELTPFLQDAELERAHYEGLVSYFVRGALHYRSPGGALLEYPGLPSKHSPRVDQMEGFARLAPLLAAWLYSGRPGILDLPDGQQADLVAILKQGLLVGTDPESKEYWGDMGRMDQRIVEAADVALVLWLTKNQIWGSLTQQEQNQLSDWLSQVNGPKIPDNNWHLFVVLVNAVLLDLGRPEGKPELLRQHYERHKRFYRGGGWYTDGIREGERFDYYNAWAIHYALFWIDRIRPALDHEFIQQGLNEFAGSYKYFFGADGLPIIGRSACYRLAAPAPLVLAQMNGGRALPVGEARRALDLTWRYFIRNGALHMGTVTQGYCGADPRVLDRYSGPGSCLWSLRSLIAAISLSPHASFWQEKPQPLPIEKGEGYSVYIGSSTWRIEGHPQTKDIQLVRGDKDHQEVTYPLETYSLLDRTTEILTHEIHRPENKSAKYNATRYSALSPYTGCILNQANPP